LPAAGPRTGRSFRIMKRYIPVLQHGGFGDEVFFPVKIFKAPAANGA
jgi:hypothetical protein